METLEQLSRRIAELDPDWADKRPGVACVDPETGDVFRLVVGHADGSYYARSRGGHGGPTCVGIWRKDELADRACFRAIAAGPDASDAATLGVILLGLGDCVRITRDGDHEWFVRFAQDRDDPMWTGTLCQTRAEAILRAEVARLEAK